MSTAAGLEVLAGVFLVVSVVLGRELLRCRDRLTRLESHLNGR